MSLILFGGEERIFFPKREGAKILNGLAAPINVLLGKDELHSSKNWN
jgi:hypothetical protein